MRMSVWIVLGLLIGGVSGIPVATMAAGFIDPFSRDGIDLDPHEWTLIKESIAKVLESDQVGARAPWEYAGTGRAGEVRITRVFQAKGMNCAEVEHVFTKGNGGRYVLPFCRVSDGSWKVAF
jgi:surface antigen